VLARSISAVYDELAGTGPTCLELPGEVDPTCRFRAAPHLL
jgi:hypothetical protein